VIGRSGCLASIVQYLASASGGDLLEKRAIHANLAELCGVRGYPAGLAADVRTVSDRLRYFGHVRPWCGTG
jgi:hypothetical protein